MDSCKACHGVWLDEGELVEILRKQDVKFNPEEIERAVAAAFRGVPIAEQESKEHCPKCSAEMTAVNYVVDSGVIIDRCPNAHGVWLDGIELETLQARHEHWETELKKNRSEWLRLAEGVRSAETKKADAQKQKTADRVQSSGPVGYIAGSILRRLPTFR